MLFKKLFDNLDISDQSSQYDENIQINKIEIDSRNVEPGDIFVCISGTSIDSHDYAVDAVKKGAVCIVAERNIENVNVPLILVEDSRKALAVISSNFYGHPEKRLKIIGITGTNGKTTTTYLVKSVLQHAGYKVALIGTNQNMIGDRILDSKLTTPNSIDLIKMFQEAVEEGCTHLVMEVSSHALEQSRVYGIQFEVAALTNITRDHLDYHGTFSKYVAAKSKIFSQCKFGLLNSDDDYYEEVIRLISDKLPFENRRVYGIRFGDLHTRNIEINNNGISYRAVSEKLNIDEKINVNIPGKFTVYNSLLAFGICLKLGINVQTISEGLTLAKSVKGRMELGDIPKHLGYSVIIDYAHTPDALENVLKSVREFTRNKLILIFGCGGNRDRTKRPIMGKIASQLADLVIVTSDNPRFEDPSTIIQDITNGISNMNKCVIIENRKEAIKYGLKVAQIGDVIVLAGKGHEIYQSTNGINSEFDEHKIIKELLHL